jgi:hypothetical protein
MKIWKFFLASSVVRAQLTRIGRTRSDADEVTEGRARPPADFENDDGKARPPSDWYQNNLGSASGSNYSQQNSGSNYKPKPNNSQESNYNTNSQQESNYKPNQSTGSNYNPSSGQTESNYNPNGSSNKPNRPAGSNYKPPNQNKPTGSNYKPSGSNYNRPKKPKRPRPTNKPGYRPNQTTRPKKPGKVNECYLGTDNCSVNANCINLANGFKCVCKSGFNGNGIRCDPVLVNECSNGSHKCDRYARCVDLVDGYDCKCNDGYKGDGYDCTVASVDECQTGQHNCSPNADCIDKSWGFRCKCKEGYVGSGIACEALDPCAYVTCAPQATCKSGLCSCMPGYTGHGQGAYGCYDIDECSRGSHRCNDNASCFNNSGAYVCECNDGYSGNGFSCNYEVPYAPEVYEPTTTTATTTTTTTTTEYATTTTTQYTTTTTEATTTTTTDMTTSEAYPTTTKAGNNSNYNGNSDTSNSGYNSDNSNDNGYSENSGGDSSNNSGYTENNSNNNNGSYNGNDNNADNNSGYSENNGNNNNNGGDNNSDYSGNTDSSNSNSDENNDNTDNYGGGNNSNNNNYNDGNNNNNNYNGSGNTDNNDSYGNVDDSNSGSQTNYNNGNEDTNTDNNSNGSNYNPGSATTASPNDPYANTDATTHVVTTAVGTACDPNPCDDNGTCIDMGSYSTCHCNSGYEMIGDNCVDIDECAPCANPNDCPCNEPEPVCSNSPGSFSCGVDTAFGDPHFRVTAPGQDPICFDVDTDSENILALFADGASALEINAQFKNVEQARKQFIRVIGFTSPDGFQMIFDTEKIEIYDKGSLRKSFNITSDFVDDWFYDVHLTVWPAGTKPNQSRHVVNIRCKSGPHFKFSSKPSAGHGIGSLGMEVESISGVQSPVGLIGQFMNSGSYSIDSNGNIQTGFVRIPAAEKFWHRESNCHEINKEHVEPFLGHSISV